MQDIRSSSASRLTRSPGAHKRPLPEGGALRLSGGRSSAHDFYRESIPNPGLNSLLEVSRRQPGAGDVQSLFLEQFTDKAKSEAEFHGLMAQVFGDGYDREKAEGFRKSALEGNFSWLPKVEFLSSGELQGALGAYDSSSGTVFLNESLKSNPALAAQTFVEEAGHHLDSLLNVKDTGGDEGELFRRLMGGEKLSAAQLEEVRREDDAGTLVVNGKSIEVEFWKLRDVLGNAAKAVVKGVNAAVNATVNAAKAVVKGVTAAVAGTVSALTTARKGVVEGVGGFVRNMVRGKPGAALGALARGADKLLIQAPTRLLETALNAVEDIAHGALSLLGPVSGPAIKLFSRVFDAGRSLVTGAWDFANSTVRNAVEGLGHAARGVGEILRGRVGDGLKSLGSALWDMTGQNIVDGVLLVGGRAVSAVQTLLGLEAPGRRLRADEIAALRAVYGESIDYSAIRIKEGDAGLFSTNDRPFCHGNTIYLKNASQSLSLLVHEAAHVWQHQNGGADYMTDSLVSQQWGHGYDWSASVPQTPWEDLEPEQQAGLLESAYAEGYFSSGCFRNKELSAYMNDVRRKLHRGVGAP